MMLHPRLSVVIPAYNESINLKSGVLDQVDNYLKKQDYTYEVLIIDDGSTDKTVELAKSIARNKKGFKIIENPHGGKAMTVMTGMMKSQGDIAVFTDMDQATPIDQIDKFFPQFAKGFDIVIGSREGRKGAPLIRKVSAWGFAALRNIILGLPIKDTQCGFKAFNRRSVEGVFPKIYGIWEAKKAGGAAVNAGFDVETLFLAKKLGFKIAEMPVNWHHVGTERVQLVKDAVEAVKDMLRIRINEIKGKYV